ncbi:MAG: CHAP domain-containing protein [Christensenellaceae bacterium]|nr:CHAP domain-containing protein [Christensenellaceae bacterium]
MNVLKIAAGEIGYSEQSDGTTRYGIWANDPQAQWCAEFICWCVSRADSIYDTDLLNNIYPYYTSRNVGRDWFIKKGRYVNRNGNIPDWGYQWYKDTGERITLNSYIPKSGDFMFLSYDGTFNTAHVALVEFVSGNSESGYIVNVIEGNNPDKVQRNQYPIDKSQILGYGTYSDNIATTMRAGNSGDSVSALQKQLYTLNYLGEGDISGFYGVKTANAVSEFQRTIPDKIINGIADITTQLVLNERYNQAVHYSANTWLVDD